MKIEKHIAFVLTGIFAVTIFDLSGNEIKDLYFLLDWRWWGIIIPLNFIITIAKD